MSRKMIVFNPFIVYGIDLLACRPAKCRPISSNDIENNKNCGDEQGYQAGQKDLIDKKDKRQLVIKSTIEKAVNSSISVSRSTLSALSELNNKILYWPVSFLFLKKI